MLDTSLFRETASSETREQNGIACVEINRPQREVDDKKEISSVEVAQKAYDETIKEINIECEGIIPKEQKTRINLEREVHKPIIMTSEEYSERFPEADPNVLGHYEANGQVYMKDGSPETLSHVATHEAMHLTSFKESNQNTYRSGLREATYNENGMREEHNRAINEGATELYALREMQRRNEGSSIEAISAYPEAQKAASELRDMVGEERMREAYFGGNLEQLKAEVIRLNYGDETAWDRFSKNVDILEYEGDEQKIRNAQIELTLQNAIMYSFKESEAWTRSDNL